MPPLWVFQYSAAASAARSSSVLSNAGVAPSDTMPMRIGSPDAGSSGPSRSLLDVSSLDVSSLDVSSLSSSSPQATTPVSSATSAPAANARLVHPPPRRGACPGIAMSTPPGRTTGRARPGRCGIPPERTGAAEGTRAPRTMLRIREITVLGGPGMALRRQSGPPEPDDDLLTPAAVVWAALAHGGDRAHGRAHHLGRVLGGHRAAHRAGAPPPRRRPHGHAVDPRPLGPPDRGPGPGVPADRHGRQRPVRRRRRGRCGRRGPARPHRRVAPRQPAPGGVDDPAARRGHPGRHAARPRRRHPARRRPAVGHGGAAGLARGRGARHPRTRRLPAARQPHRRVPAPLPVGPDLARAGRQPSAHRPLRRRRRHGCLAGHTPHAGRARAGALPAGRDAAPHRGPRVADRLRLQPHRRPPPGRLAPGARGDRLLVPASPARVATPRRARRLPRRRPPAGPRQLRQHGGRPRRAAQRGRPRGAAPGRGPRGRAGRPRRPARGGRRRPRRRRGAARLADAAVRRPWCTTRRRARRRRGCGRASRPCRCPCAPTSSSGPAASHGSGSAPGRSRSGACGPTAWPTPCAGPRPTPGCGPGRGTSPRGWPPRTAPAGSSSWWSGRPTPSPAGQSLRASTR